MWSLKRCLFGRSDILGSREEPADPASIYYIGKAGADNKYSFNVMIIRLLIFTFVQQLYGAIVQNMAYRSKVDKVPSRIPYPLKCRYWCGRSKRLT